MDVTALIHRFRGPLTALLQALGHDPRQALELAQDTFAHAYVSRERFKGDWDKPSDTGPWLYGIARNVHRTHLRKHADSRVQVVPEVPEVERVPLNQDTNRESFEIRHILASLRRDWHEVLTLRYSGDHTLAEIAALLGLSERAVEGRLRRARNELKNRLNLELPTSQQGRSQS